MAPKGYFTHFVLFFAIFRCVWTNEDEEAATVRLVGGTVSYGTVELSYRGHVGLVCDDSWDRRDADVVCRMLGFRQGAWLVTIENSYNHPGGADFLLDNVHCRGDETNLAQCEHNGFRQHNCGTKEAAGVVCKGVSSGPSEGGRTYMAAGARPALTQRTLEQQMMKALRDARRRERRERLWAAYGGRRPRKDDAWKHDLRLRNATQSTMTSSI